jgi:hypothetical protein
MRHPLLDQTPLLRVTLLQLVVVGAYPQIQAHLRRKMVGLAVGEPALS